MKLTPLQKKIAQGLSEGYTHEEIAKENNNTQPYISKLLKNSEFAKYVDKLTFEKEQTEEAEILRIIRRNIRQKEGSSTKDLLDWVKLFYDRKKTGVNINLAQIQGQVTNEYTILSDRELIDRARAEGVNIPAPFENRIKKESGTE